VSHRVIQEVLHENVRLDNIINRDIDAKNYE